MTAYARRADLVSRSQRSIWKAAFRSRFRFAAGCGIAAASCLVAGSIALAQDSVLVEDLALPAPTMGNSFEDPDDHSESVLVDDGAAVGLPVDTTAVESLRNSHDNWAISGDEYPPEPLAQTLDGSGIQITDVAPFAGEWLAGCTHAISKGMNWRPGGCGPHNGHGYACGLDGHGGPCQGKCGGGGSHCGNRCCGGCRPGCLWAVQADALVFWRNNIAGQPLLLDDVGAVALDAGDAQTSAAAGPRIGLLRSLGCGRAVELSYFNVGGIQGSTATAASGGPYTPVGLADIRFVDIEQAEYTTRGQIKSFEANYRWAQGRRIIWLAGVRWVEWNELATVDMEPSGDAIQTQAGNDLYGGQFGCRLRFWDLGKWQVTGVGKAGVFGNTSYQRTTANIGVDAFGPLGADDTDVSFFGEVGVNSTLWLCDWLAWRAGYNFFWLQGVATAPQQFSLVNFGSDSASINTNGAVFLQGFSTGLEARW